jgi:hypothetical protein
MELEVGSKGNRKVIPNCIWQGTNFSVSVWNKNADEKTRTSQIGRVTDRNYFVSHVWHPMGRGDYLRTQTERSLKTKKRLQQELCLKIWEFYLHFLIGFHIVVWINLYFIFLPQLQGDWLVTVKWHGIFWHDLYVKCPTHGSIPDFVKSVTVISKNILENATKM